MSQESIITWIEQSLPGTDVQRPQAGDDAPAVAIGDTFFIYDPERNFKGAQRMPYATIVTKDYPDFDAASDLNRSGVFRLNVGLPKETFQSLFPDPSARHDFAALDVLMPHPTYGRQYWACILNPKQATFERLRPLLAEAYALAVKRVNCRDDRS
jgi:hypothetical protein